MKTYKRLYPRICDFENLYLAYRKARRGKRSRPDVAAFEFNLEFELPQLQEELMSETYRPGPYRHFTLYERKPRRISAAPFRDRVVHHALCNLIEPIWEARFIHDSYACRVRKGTHAALDRCTCFARRYRYVLQGDIVQFFPSVDHATLYALLARRVACRPTLRLGACAGASCGVSSSLLEECDDETIAHFCQNLRSIAVAHPAHAGLSQKPARGVGPPSPV